MTIEIQDYQRLEAYGPFLIECSINETPTMWCIGVRIGIQEGNKFVEKFPSAKKEFPRADGALNCGLAMLDYAKRLIDKGTMP
ncbi:MAG: hypothetical protein P4L72_07865 [Parvibaculum sp.]|jgi:hypothetical protein|uniref:hypothetical protein n=1 Tax=Parvibaculum sp. TaxID=2024848 RepID=UPI00283B3CCF|nr:hypothetical protein [Parvibaculum sp.]MDR3499128.1 hypothetical protein [Parvibaculum sp.]